MKLSIVVPTLDEAGRIAAALAPLQPLRRAGHEVIVVDGGSRDATIALARPLADRVLLAPRGRASQMNAGARAARGDLFLFLHADTVLPPTATGAIAAAVLGGRRWGRFDVTIAGRSRMLPVVAALMNLRSRLTGIATGDMAMFVERRLFEKVGGFPPLPLMEDVALSQRLKRAAGRPAARAERVTTSGRRWDAHGAWRTILSMWRLRLAYRLGADPERLAARYASPPQRPLPILQVFVKDPRPGAVKTRLAPAIGPERAARVYLDLVEHTLRIATAARASQVIGAIELWCAPSADRPAFAAWRDRYQARLFTQTGADLGERMRNALESALRRGAPAILVGSDCPALDVDYVARAAAALRDHDAVLGPAEDGGYVLVGLSRAIDAFGGIAWSTPGVMAATRDRLAARQASWRELPPLWDLDTPDDLARWEAHRALSRASA